MADLSDLLTAAVEHAGSDLHLKVGAAPHLRVDGKLTPLDLPVLTSADTERLADDAIPAHRKADFAATGEADFALSVPGVGRFRVNVHRQRGSVGMVLRRVLPGIPQLDELGLPAAVTKLIDGTRGLVLVTGPAGAGKTTTLAAMVDRLNATRPCSIVTIEDPVEVLHTDKQGIVCQREVGTDTPSYESALAHVWRQDPDVIAIGSLRDPETVQAALTLAETGHLVLATLPTTGAAETVNRLLELFPPSRHQQLRTTLARVLRGVVSQRLLERADGRGRIAATELLVCTERVADRIAESPTQVSFDDLIADGELHGMQSFDESLFLLCREQAVDVREAIAAATDPRDLKVSLESAGLA
jgi:twitching motility protein PilT